MPLQTGTPLAKYGLTTDEPTQQQHWHNAHCTPLLVMAPARKTDKTTSNN